MSMNDAPAPPPPIRQVAVVVPLAEAELAADALWQLGVLGIEEFAGTKAGTDEPSESVCLVVTPADGDVDRILAAFPDSPTQVLELAAEDYERFVDSWQDFAEPVRAGRGVVLWPSWVSDDPSRLAPGDVVVHLFAGRAFGSGSHVTTRLAVAALESHVGPDDTVVDVGCGTGALAVVALRLGARAAVAVDVDEEAVAVTRINALENEVVLDVRLGSTEVVATEEAGSVVVANLTAGLLIDLADELLRVRAAGGLLLVTGVLVERRAEVVAALEARGEVLDLEGEADGWVLLGFRERGPARSGAGVTDFSP